MQHESTGLTPRNESIVKLVATGATNPQIGLMTGLSTGTVKIYVHRIMRKTGMRNRTELALWWIRTHPESQSE